MIGPYDWHYDRDGDGELDFFERYERDDDLDRFARRGIYADNSFGIDNPDDFDEDFDLDDEDDDLFDEDDGFDFDDE